MRLTLLAAGLTPAVLFSLLPPAALAAPSFKHSHHHQPQQIARLSTDVSADAVDVAAVKAKSSPVDNEHHSGPVIFEHKHQRLFKAGPNDAVVREIYDPNVMAKRDARGGIVYVTKYETFFVGGSDPTGFPRWNFGPLSGGAPTGIGFIPFASLEASLAGSTATAAVSAAATAAPVISSASVGSSLAVSLTSSASVGSSSAVSLTYSASSAATPTSAAEVLPSAESSTLAQVVALSSAASDITSTTSTIATVQSDPVNPVEHQTTGMTITPTSSSIVVLSSSSQSEVSTISTLQTAAPSTQIAVPSSKVSGIMQSISYATALATPVLQGGQYLGYVTQEPVMEYIPHTNEQIPALDPSLLGSGINDDLITNYKIFNGSGSLIYKKVDTTVPLTQTPWMSRDNGKGGYLNGYQIFMYADTGVTILANDNAFGGFVSTSVAVDKGRLASQGKAPMLQDMMGEWDDSAAVPRGFVPFTIGEAAYTGQSGKRYAIWPESSLIYLDSETALCYAAIVYIDTNAESLFAEVGNTLIKVRVPGIGGPVAHRAVPLMYGADELNFGVIGGIRSWGSSGPGGSDGSVYVFGNAGTAGLLLGRVSASQVEDKSAYEYFNNDTQTWSSTAPSKNNPTGFFVEGPYSNVDIFYSPRHLTFIMVYQTPYADNNFWWRYLQTSTAIIPSYAGGSDDDIVDSLHKYPWSEPALLYSAPKPGNGGYIYAGGVQMGYFDADDIVNGGSKMLLQWTAPVAQDDPRGYDTGTAIVTFA